MSVMGSTWSNLTHALGSWRNKNADDCGIPLIESARDLDPLDHGIVLAEELRELDVLLKDSGVGKKRTFSDTDMGSPKAKCCIDSDAPLTPVSMYSDVSSAAEAYKAAYGPEPKKQTRPEKPKEPKEPKKPTKPAALRIKTGSDLEMLSDEEIDMLWTMATDHRDEVIRNRRAQVEAQRDTTVLDLPTPDMFGPGQLGVARAVNSCPCCAGTGWYEVRIHYRATEDGKVQLSRMPASVEHSIEGHRRAVNKEDHAGAMCCCNPPSFKHPQALTPLGAMKLVNDTLALFPQVEAELAPLVQMLRVRRPDKA